MPTAVVDLLEPRRLPVLEAPRRRGDCVGGPRPCPWACRHNLRVEPRWRLGQASCSLDVADAGGATTADVAAILGVTRQRVEQIQERAIGHALAAAERLR
jgi:hypothetical protein